MRERVEGRRCGAVEAEVESSCFDFERVVRVEVASVACGSGSLMRRHEKAVGSARFLHIRSERGRCLSMSMSMSCQCMCVVDTIFYDCWGRPRKDV